MAAHQLLGGVLGEVAAQLRHEREQHALAQRQRVARENRVGVNLRAEGKRLARRRSEAVGFSLLNQGRDNQVTAAAVEVNNQNKNMLLPDRLSVLFVSEDRHRIKPLQQDCQLRSTQVITPTFGFALGNERRNGLWMVYTEPPTGSLKAALLPPTLLQQNRTKFLTT